MTEVQSEGDPVRKSTGDIRPAHISGSGECRNCARLAIALAGVRGPRVRITISVRQSSGSAVEVR